MDSLIKQRGTIKGKLTRAQKWDNPTDLITVETRLEMLKSIEQEFENVQTQIENISEDNEAQELERTTFENSIFQQKVRLKKLKVEFQPQEISLASVPSADTHATVTTEPKLKLPKLNIPPFSGKWDEWASFSELFTHMVHNEPSLSKLQKFYYLRLALTGEASAHIQALALTAANYEEAWKLLVKRYDNRRLIINNHVKAIFDLPIASNEQGLRAFLDTFSKNLRALNALNLPTKEWDVLLTHLIATKLSHGLRRQWEISLEDSTRLPTLDECVAFLEQRAAAAQVLGQTSKSAQSYAANNQSNSQKYTHVIKNDQCPFCKSSHFPYQCPTYHKAPITEREALVQKHKLCKNCLHPRHQAPQCKSTTKCKKCNLAHHTSLHHTKPSEQTKAATLNPSASEYTNLSTTYSAATSSTQYAHPASCDLNTHVCLPTAYITATDGNREIKTRAMIDSCSQNTFITERLARKLRLKPIPTSSGSVEGFGGCRSAPPQFMAFFTVRANQLPFEIQLTAKITPLITSYKPRTSEKLLNLIHANGLIPADTFENPNADIDILIGGEYCPYLMQPNKMELSPDLPPLLHSSFGWLISGKFSLESPADQSQLCFLTLECQLRQFWELEEAPHHQRNPSFTTEEQQCEDLFIETTTRDHTGRYVVKLPFKENLHEIGESKRAAERQFLQIEKKMERDASYGEKYRSFMIEYETLNHMSKAIPKTTNYFLPHHAVTRPDNPSKFRVVFNGSKPTSSGISLNDTLCVGPTLQNDIFSILARFRLHKVGIVADIEKMYRQILVHPDHRCYQMILWRNNSTQSLDAYELNTVTYGLACAPYLAVRCLRQLAMDEGKNHPAAAKALLNDDYVDDVVTGAESTEAALTLAKELTCLAASGQFKLRKWHSNDPTVQKTVQEPGESQFSFNDGNYNKTLGLLWDTKSDEFVFHSNLTTATNGGRNITKRELLSELSRIFDPLGLLAPIIVVAKIILQQLWLLPISWDTPVPDQTQSAYLNFRLSAADLPTLRIPRFIGTEPLIIISLHGFSDASENAYAACVYIAVTDTTNTTNSHLVCAKTRVAPLKPVSIPRLELCGAALLARTFHVLRTEYHCPIEQCFSYTDSTVVLTWISQPPRTWKTFVSNRVAEIITHMPATQWRHVNSDHNSADIASRGSSVQSLVDHTLWWSPPLPPPLSTFKLAATQRNALQEARKPKVINLLITTNDSVIRKLLTKFFSYTKLLRVLAYVLRAVSLFKGNNAPAKHLTPSELRVSRDHLILCVQQEAFSVTIARLRDGKPLKKKDNLRSLGPILDSNGLLRVGGRLTNSSLSFDQKQPILLPSKSKFTAALIESIHITNLHAGTLLTIAILRQEYWIINARDTVRKIIHHCHVCKRFNSSHGIQQPTGNLPAARVRPSRPFSAVGIDFAGPVETRYSLSRAKVTKCKSYIALFICMATKAVHLELVSSLSTDAFLAALSRFTSRRGLPNEIYSDNGTNFTGADNKLKEIYAFLRSMDYQPLADQMIQWHFIPPSAPNFGGLWEAGVKAVKRHLIPSLKASLLTFEEISTILTQIEACLNSRPITTLATNPNDVTLLTPAHFLIGESLKTPPTLHDVPDNLNLQKRWKMTQTVTKQFWARWSKEYLTQLQQKPNTVQATPIKVNEIVLIKENNTPPLHWPLGRITAVHPGNDGIVRVATIQTAKTIIKRPVSKLIRLPTEDRS